MQEGEEEAVIVLIILVLKSDRSFHLVHCIWLSEP